MKGGQLWIEGFLHTQEMKGLCGMTSWNASICSFHYGKSFCEYLFAWFNCQLVHLPFCLHQYIWDGAGQLQLLLRNRRQWQWGRATDAKEDGWTFAALNSLCVCNHESVPTTSVSGFSVSYGYVRDYIGGNWMRETQQLSWILFFFNFLLCSQN